MAKPKTPRAEQRGLFDAPPRDPPAPPVTGPPLRQYKEVVFPLTPDEVPGTPAWRETEAFVDTRQEYVDPPPPATPPRDTSHSSSFPTSIEAPKEEVSRPAAVADPYGIPRDLPAAHAAWSAFEVHVLTQCRTCSLVTPLNRCEVGAALYHAWEVARDAR